ncbi:hypothetical protein KTAU_33340 [Thermogemmatispora aurantia]|uniref:Uncharacterized protein n=1 Tax=Thermogemmatispora aurantia TaxID=2045279 RepID=A0A5J4K7W9_9CHLR|nr:hypothetical protein KTAU_33340 [Thermogemmatispora aurantia]
MPPWLMANDTMPVKKRSVTKGGRSLPCSGLRGAGPARLVRRQGEANGLRPACIMKGRWRRGEGEEAAQATLAQPLSEEGEGAGWRLAALSCQRGRGTLTDKRLWGRQGLDGTRRDQRRSLDKDQVCVYPHVGLGAAIPGDRPLAAPTQLNDRAGDLV